MVLRHLDLQLKPEQIERLANSEQGAIEWILWEVKARIQDAIAAKRFRPSSGRKSRMSSTTSSASTSRGIPPILGEIFLLKNEFSRK